MPDAADLREGVYVLHVLSVRHKADMSLVMGTSPPPLMGAGRARIRCRTLGAGGPWTRAAV